MGRMQNPFARDHKVTQNEHDRKRVRLVGGKLTKFNGDCLKAWIGA